MRKRRTRRLRGLKVAVLGAGAVGSSLAGDLHRAGAELRVWSRRRASARRLARMVDGVLSRTPGEAAGDADLVLLCVSDRAIEPVARALAREWRTRPGKRAPVALHTSGFHGEKPLRPLHALGWPVGTLHPVTAFFRTRSGIGVALAREWFATRATGRAAQMASRVVRGLQGKELRLSGGDREKRAYHLACTLVSNGAVALFDLAREVLHRRDARSREALASLLTSTAFSLRLRGKRRSLSGPVARGDAVVVAGHLALLRGRPDDRRLYQLLSRRLLALSDLPARDRGAIERLIR
jgi:predicted short-subunit dehydrogenase-like oxidoreductase (DUF2520 family)